MEMEGAGRPVGIRFPAVKTGRLGVVVGVPTPTLVLTPEGPGRGLEALVPTPTPVAEGEVRVAGAGEMGVEVAVRAGSRNVPCKTVLASQEVLSSLMLARSMKSMLGKALAMLVQG